MKINKDYREVMRIGKQVDKCLYRRQHESAFTVGMCILLAIILIALATLLNLK